MMNKNWKKKMIISVLAMAMIMQQVGVSNVAYAKQDDINTRQVRHYFDNDYDFEDDYEDDDDYEDEDDNDFEDDYEDDNDFEDDNDYEDDNDFEDEDDDVEDYEDEEWIKPSMAVSSLTLKKGGTSKLAIEGDWQEVIWSSSKKSVAKVDRNGKVTGIKAGTAVITATVSYYDDEEELDDWEDVDWEDVDSEDVDSEDEIGDYDEDDDTLSVMTFECTVKVVAAPIKISAKKISMKVGKTKKLKVTGATGKVTWKSSNKRVAKVVKGKVTAKKAGKTTITAKVGRKTLKCMVTVKKK